MFTNDYEVCKARQPVFHRRGQTSIIKRVNGYKVWPLIEHAIGSHKKEAEHMKSTTVVVDGTTTSTVRFPSPLKRRTQTIGKKNILTSFVSMVGATAVHLKATHLLVCFDPPRTFRHDIYPKYKGIAKKRDTTLVRLPSGQEVEHPGDPGSLVKPARRALENCRRGNRLQNRERI